MLSTSRPGERMVTVVGPPDRAPKISARCAIDLSAGQREPAAQAGGRNDFGAVPRPASPAGSGRGRVRLGRRMRVPALDGARGAQQRVEHHRQLHRRHRSGGAGCGTLQECTLAADVVAVRVGSRRRWTSSASAARSWTSSARRASRSSIRSRTSSSLAGGDRPLVRGSRLAPRPIGRTGAGAARPSGRRTRRS